MSTLTQDQIWISLQDVKDPEIPVISVVELGIVRDVTVEGESVSVTITPTFSGCPALQTMQERICTQLLEMGAREVDVQVTLAPPWSTDWISPEGKAKLKDFGLSPPRQHNGNIEVIFDPVQPPACGRASYCAGLGEPVQCPYCDSYNTSVKNNFGSTACRAIHYCNQCQQPFEQFKPL